MVLTIKIKTKGLKELNSKWKLFRKMPNKIVKEVDTVGNTITRLARQLAPTFEGRLKEGIDYEIVPKKNGYSLEIINDVPYSYFQEYGFAPHFIPVTPYVERWLKSKGVTSWRPFIYVKKPLKF